MELLSPAGNRDALVAAISCGADAVYLGYTAFGARSYAGNFDADQLREAIEYAHERGKKIYVTVNTLVKQCEVDDLCDVLELLVKTGADAAIVQDIGVVHIARERFPELTLHASTQMTIHNAQGASLMKSTGLTRVVPARECPLSELRKMADVGVEIEAFAHGALCVAVSGQCLFSSMIGGRSGNRGRCAQPCRLPYRLDNGTNGYLLSTRDLMLIDKIPQMRDAGVYSFKLEGRMKRPEYVGIITRAYREAIDAAEENIPYHPDAKTIRDLKQIFNRGGFTEGYVMERSNAALMSWERPNHWGIRVGRITSMRGPLAKVLLDEPLHNGDGLQVRGKEDIDLTYSGNDISAGNEAIVRIANGRFRQGDPVYRLTDAVQMQEIREVMASENVRIPLQATLYAMPDQPPVLTLIDEAGHQIRVAGAQNVDHAQQRALDHAAAFKQLSKTGGTPYVLSELELISEQAFMTAGMLNSLRRDALDAMRKVRIRVTETHVSRKNPKNIILPSGEHLLIAQSEKLSEAKELLNSGADLFYWDPQIWSDDYLEREIANSPVTPVLVLPSVMRTDELNTVHLIISKYAERFAGIQLNNVGQFELEWPVPVFGGQGLNVMNRNCAEFFTKLGAKRLTASCELSLKEIHELTGDGGNFEIEAYGRTLLMLLHHCPIQTASGNETQSRQCNACADRNGCPQVYTDRKGYRFPTKRLKMPHGCVVRLYNSVETDMAKYSNKLYQAGCSLRVSFTDEPFSRRKEIVASYRSILDAGVPLHQPADSATSGHIARGIE